MARWKSWLDRALAPADAMLVRRSAHEARVARLSALEGELGDPTRAAPTTIAAEFDADLQLIAIGHALGRILQARLARPEIRFALVGHDPALARKAYHLLDFGLRPSGFFEGPSDFMFGSQDLDDLSADTAELLIVSDDDPAREASLLARIALREETRAGLWRVVRLRRLVDAHRSVLRSLVAGRFSTCLTPTKLAGLACAIALSPGVGVAVEAGVFMGGGTVYLARLQRALGIERPIFAFDTFSGIPAPGEQDGDTPFTEGLFAQGTLSAVQANYRTHAVADDIELVAGLVQETLAARLPPASQIAFALLDLDQYAGTRAGLDTVVPRLHPRGIIAVDDADGPGPDAAIEETLAAHPELMRCRASTGFDLLLRRDVIGVLSEMPA